MALNVDASKCIGCGACASVCPDGFEVGSDGKAHVKNPDAPCAEQGKNSCPVAAISL